MACPKFSEESLSKVSPPVGIIAAAREAGINVKASVRGFDDPLTPAIQEARWVAEF
jgi:hypothetical protein